MRATAGAKPDGIPIVSNSLQICMDEYAAMMSPFAIAQPMRNNSHTRPASLRVWQADLWAVAFGKNGSILRSRGKQEIQNGGHLLEVTRFINGSERGYSGDTLINRVPGPIYVLDQKYPITTINSDYRVQQLIIAKSSLEIPEDGEICEREIDTTSSLGRMVADSMNVFYAELEQGTGVVPNHIAERFFALLKVSIGVHPERGDVRAHFRDALCDRIKRYIETRLGDPALCTDQILSRFGLSRASLYRMFEPFGGVRSYIMQRRAVRAAIDIVIPPNARGKLRRVSENWGFSTQPNFNRSIRSMFGVAPSKLLAKPKEDLQINANETAILRGLAERAARAA